MTIQEYLDATILDKEELRLIQNIFSNYRFKDVLILDSVLQSQNPIHCLFTFQNSALDCANKLSDTLDKIDEMHGISTFIIHKNFTNVISDGKLMSIKIGIITKSGKILKCEELQGVK